MQPGGELDQGEPDGQLASNSFGKDQRCNWEVPCLITLEKQAVVSKSLKSNLRPGRRRDEVQKAE